MPVRMTMALSAILLVLAAAWPAFGRDAALAPVIPCRVLASMPHDPDAFTQGLVWSRGRLLESVGGFGVSDVRATDPATGKVLRSRRLPADRFAEGLALTETKKGRRLVQLTWRAGLAHFLDPGTFEPLGEARYRGEGWGLAWDGRSLVMSDGSDTLAWRDPDDFTVLRRVPVTDGGRPVPMLNELEWVPDLDQAGPLILANVLGRDLIAAIEPNTGAVRFWIDCSELYPPRERRSPYNVLNGTAWDPDSRSLYVTGKRWPRMFVIRIEPPR